MFSIPNISGWECLLDLVKGSIEAREALFCCLWQEEGRKETTPGLSRLLGVARLPGVPGL